MFREDARDLSSTEHYRILTGSVIPRPVWVITTVSPEGIVNAAPFSYTGLVSTNPPILSLSVLYNKGEKKDTARNILATKQAVVHVVDTSNVEEANKTSARLEYNDSELALTNFTTEDSLVVDVPSLKEAKIRYEVELFQHTELENLDFFLLKVVGYAMDEDVCTEEFKIIPEKLAALGKLYSRDYIATTDVVRISNKNRDH